jgi:hypothetical protein
MHEIASALQMCLEERKRRTAAEYRRLITRASAPPGNYEAVETARQIMPLMDALGISQAQALEDINAQVIPRGEQLAGLVFDGREGRPVPDSGAQLARGFMVYSEIYVSPSPGIGAYQFVAGEGQPKDEFAALKKVMDLRLRRIPEIPEDERVALLIGAGVPRASQPHNPQTWEGNSAQALARKNAGWMVLFWVAYTVEMKRRDPKMKGRAENIIYKLGGRVPPTEASFPQNNPQHGETALAKAARGIGKAAAAVAGKW